MPKFRLLLLITFLFILGSLQCFSQDTLFARQTILELTSKKYHGRGYVKKGDLKAAHFIAKTFKNNKLKPLGEKGYFQAYHFPINSFPSPIKVIINDKKLTPGTDFVIFPNAPSTKGTFETVDYKGTSFDTDSIRNEIGEVDLSDKFLVIHKYNREFAWSNPMKARGIITITKDEKLFWSVGNAQKVADYTIIEIQENCLDENLKSITIDFKNKFLPNYNTNNIIAYVPGTVSPDSFLVYTAHYDHLGMMGNKTYFPGANDNASGTTMMMDLAKHYAQNPGKYSIAFIAFSGEEAGILGSKYFAEHPTFPLENIRFLINLDMVGTGSEGITAVNATVFRKEFEALQSINTQKNYLTKIKSRGEACNSDHCPLYQKDVPCFFIYTMGEEYTEYHNIDDLGSKVPLTEYSDLFRLLIDFNDVLQNNRQQ